MELSVKILREGVVEASGATPECVLDLSLIDRVPVLRCNARTLHVYKNHNNNKQHVAQVIREALSKALVPYYPLAGRSFLDTSNNNDLQIQCQGQGQGGGVWFVEASADCDLEALNYLLDDHKIISTPYDKLLPDSDPDPAHDNMLLRMQVTEFRCGGFVIGLVFCHSICDGLGAAQFLNAVGEFARGAHQLTITPVWSRDFLTNPNTTLLPGSTTNMAHMPPPPPVPHTHYKLEHANIDVPLHHIARLKQDLKQLTNATCSSFEIVAAALWRHRTRAIINQQPHTEDMKLVFFANCRHLINPPLPKGFYGNCFFPVTVTAPSQMLIEASIPQVVQLIQQGKARLAEEFWKWVRGDLMRNGVDPFAPPLLYTTLFISEWGRLGFNQVDYGWGPPLHVVPIQGSSIIPVAIVGSSPSPVRGVRLMTWCVHQAHLNPFLQYMTQL